MSCIHYHLLIIFLNLQGYEDRHNQLFRIFSFFSNKIQFTAIKALNEKSSINNTVEKVG